jgi:hypothetical protein
LVILCFWPSAYQRSLRIRKVAFFGVVTGLVTYEI